MQPPGGEIHDQRRHLGAGQMRDHEVEIAADLDEGRLAQHVGDGQRALVAREIVGGEDAALALCARSEAASS